MNYSTPEIVPKFNLAAYQIHEKIGEGGFGHVYKAKQITTGQSVAIKFLTLSPEFDAEKKRRYIDRFERETELVSRLQHPNVVRLLDKGRVEDERLYAVFEYVEGMTLKDMLRESGALSPIETADVMAQVLDALVHAHQEGVIHRDLKPANIMLSKVGAKTHAKILDFGIGSLTKEARQLEYKTITLTQETLGTPSYSAPEQLRGEPPTPKTDLYVWGLVFIECMTGQQAIRGSNLASIFHKQLSPSNVPLPPALVGHPVASMLRRVLHKNTQERAGSAGDIYRELQQLNFSTLVGDLETELYGEGLSAALKGSQPSGIVSELNETLINDSQFFYTGQTERKQLTTLCMSLSVRAVNQEYHDPEVVDALHRDQKAQCIDTAIRYGGFHVGTLGDMLLFYFGYPTVSDNDSRLCARTALDITSSLKNKNALLRQNQGIVAEVRMGMHAGVVTTYNDIVPEGDSPNIAMELTRLAQANQILCSDSSKIILDNYLEFEPDRVKSLGVVLEGRPLFLLTGERQVEAFGFLRSRRSNYDFVGREQELAQLVALLNSDSSHSIVHIHGEAGIGKSRLIFELRDSAKGMYHYIAQCLPEHKFNALYPILNLLRHKFSLDAVESEAAVEILRNRLNQDKKKDVATTLTLLCAWLHLPMPSDLEVVTLPPDEQKRVLFDTLNTLLLIEQDDNEFKSGIVFVFEDVHWADPTTIEFVNRFLQSSTLKKSQNVFVTTSRQVLPDAFSELNINHVNVEKLSDVKTAEFIVNLFDKKNVSPNVIDVLVSRTDGIPLFIEELVNMLKQKSLVHHLNGVTDFVDPDKLADVPANLRDSLQQKLDALVYAKETAQLAAIIGREFDYDLLVGASVHSEEQVQSDLDELIEAELVYLQRKVGGDSYLFKHALVRDAAYESMLAQTRRAMHLRVAECLQKSQQAETSKDPALIASHYGLAEQYFSAAQSITHAIKNAVSLSIYVEAQAYFEQSQQWIAHLPVNDEVLALDLLLNENIFPAFIAREGLGSQQVADIGNRVVELEHKLGVDENQVSDARFMSQYAELQNFHYRSETDKALSSGLKALEDARRGKHRQRELVLLAQMIQVHMCVGDLPMAIEAGQRALDLYDEAEDAGLRHQFGWEPKCIALCYLSHAYAVQGSFTLAYQACADAKQLSDKLGSEVNKELAAVFDVLTANLAGNTQLILSLTDDFNDNRDGSGDSWYVLFTQMTRDWSNKKNTRITKEFYQMMRKEGRGGPYYYWLIMGLETEIEKQNYDLAKEMIEEILLLAQDAGLAGPLPQLHKTLANIYCHLGDITQAEKLYKKALDQSCKLQTHMVSLDIALDYGRLLVSDNRTELACKQIKRQQEKIATDDYQHLDNNKKLLAFAPLLNNG